MATLLGREGATAGRQPVRVWQPAAGARRNGSWINRATVATAVVTFGSVLAVGSTFLPHGRQIQNPDVSPSTTPSTDPAVTEALSAWPPSNAPVATPTGSRSGAAKTAEQATKPAAPQSVTPRPAVPKPAVPKPAAPAALKF
ncbi:MAG TPA: hypothetical protein VIQ30_16890, partial [Pseudonocardia sp.]